MDLNKADIRMTVEAEAITWMTVHGNLLLALRHPQNVATSAKIVTDFATMLGELLVESGLLSQADLDNTLAIERVYRGRGN